MLVMWIVANLCKRTTDFDLRFVVACSKVDGSRMMSDGSSDGGTTDEMFATSTSGTLPIGPVNVRTGRSFLAELSP